MKKPYALDWEEIRPGVLYSKSLERWYSNNKIYDRRSAEHNGIIGPGFELKKYIKECNT